MLQRSTWSGLLLSAAVVSAACFSVPAIGRRRRRHFRAGYAYDRAAPATSAPAAAETDKRLPRSYRSVEVAGG